LWKNVIFRESEDAENERCGLDLHRLTLSQQSGQKIYLSERKTAGTAKERSSIWEQGFDLLGNSIGKSNTSILLLLSRDPQDREEQRMDLCEVCINEEVDSSALQGSAGLRAGLHKVRRVGVYEELGDDGGFGDDFSIVGEWRDEAAGVNCQVFRCAGDGKINWNMLDIGLNWEGGLTDDGFEFDTKLFEGNLSSMSPRAVVIGVEDDFWWGRVGTHDSSLR
jgi:hypothetical protein